MNRDRKELGKRMEHALRELIERMDRDKAELMALIKQSAERGEEAFRATKVQLENLDKKIDLNHKWLDRKIDREHGCLDRKIDWKHDWLDRKVDWKHDWLDRKVDWKHDWLDRKIDRIRE